MARKRMIDPTIWQDEDFGTLSPEAMILFIGIFSNADDEGIIPANPIFLTSTIFPYKPFTKDAAIKLRGEVLDKIKSLKLYEIDGKEYIWLSKWNQWQRIDRPSESKYPSFDESSTNHRRSLDPSIDKYNIDKISIDIGKPQSKIAYLDNQDFLISLKEQFPNINIEREIEKMKDWLASNGKIKKDYSAFARNWLRNAKQENEEVLIVR